MNLMQPFVDALNMAIKHYLKTDPMVEQNLQPLVGKIVALDFVELKKPIYLCFQKDTILLQSDYQGEPDASLRGSCFSFAKMGVAMKQQQKGAGFGGKLTMVGDVEVAQRVNEFLTQLELDWEGQLAQWVGDVPARQIANLWRKGSDYTQESWQQVQINLTEFLQEECRVLPAQEAVEDFYKDISELRMAADRLDARVKRLQTQRESG